MIDLTRLLNRMSKEEQVMNLIRKHMESMSLEKKDNLISYYTNVFFPREDQGYFNNIKWTTSKGETFVTMWDEKHLKDNLRLAMIKEVMGVGPEKYCIINNWMPHFESRLLLLIHFLPHRKFCIYPQTLTLGGPFSRSPWLEIGEAICKRTNGPQRSLFPLVDFRETYYSRQYAVPNGKATLGLPP